ncbi:MAG TPA: SDR family NAD(P)-dependent oxidoreductase, partial [Actinoplanes sp.]|nr:SDR family NAD(P)-dependent oxidoreductase [Actinoplanes sp.]
MSRRILITGAGSGLGRAMATVFGDPETRLLVSDVDATAAEAVAKELDAAFLPLDVTDDAAWLAAREWCEREWGGLDVLVNNAGVASSGRFE